MLSARLPWVRAAPRPEHDGRCRGVVDGGQPISGEQGYECGVWATDVESLLSVLSVIFLALPTIQAQTRLMIGAPLQFRVTKKL